MFVRPSAILFSVIALAGVVSALPSGLEARTGVSNTCNKGSVQCCKTVQSASSKEIIQLFGELKLPLPPSGTMVGLTCSPITASGGSSTGSICTQQTVCCTGDKFDGISTACSPTTINL